MNSILATVYYVVFSSIINTTVTVSLPSVVIIKGEETKIMSTVD